MKKSFLSMFALAALLMTGCSSEEVTPNGGDVTNGNGEAETSYLSVNLMSAGGTRAAKDYEDGDADENEVKTVRFYFFTESGAPANVKLLKINGVNTYVNYYDWSEKEEDFEKNDDDETNDDIESILSATIVINTASGDKLPQRIAAILNPAPDVLGENSRSLSSLKGIYRNYADADLTKAGAFVMFNSVYADGDTEVNSTFIKAENLATSKEAALAAPVKIYVERSVAKVRVSLASSVGFDENTGMLALTDSKGTALKVDDKQVYLKISEWSLTADTDKGRLVKDIDPKWDGTWWNGPSYSGAELYRSFWAINAPDAKNLYHTYNEIESKISNTTSLYTNENAEDLENGDQRARTKVILKGTLCNAEGKAFTIVRHLGAYFGDDPKNFDNLKNSILAQLRASGNNYYYDGDPVEVEENGETKTKIPRKEIDKSCLQIVVLKQVSEEESDNNCYVCAQLTTDAAERTWYDSPAEDAVPLEKAAATINSVLKYDTERQNNVVDKALVWNSGMTYYYYEILHKGIGASAKNQAGVVRNHIYDTRVTKIFGFGTPVYDPAIKIYPEKPTANDHYIAAEIDILSWRVVKNDYVLEW